MKSKKLALIHPSGKVLLDKNEIQKRIQFYENHGFELEQISPEIPSDHGCTSAPVLERVALLAFALTSRKYFGLFAARGGVGCTELIPYLEQILPPILPPKFLVGFSDISFLGVYLASRYPNFQYIHGPIAYSHFFERGLPRDQEALFTLLNGERHETEFSTDTFEVSTNQTKFSGPICAINLSLLVNLCHLPYISLPKNCILFIEDWNEYLYRMIRKCDALILSQKLENVQGIVLGKFTNCSDPNDLPTSPTTLCSLFHSKTKKPVWSLEIFGHDDENFPLLMNSTVRIEKNEKYFHFYFSQQLQPETDQRVSTFSDDLFLNKDHQRRIHFSGIGGTGMAQVAGLAHFAGFTVTGSDNPIYPPMDQIIRDLEITPDEGFTAENVRKREIDGLVVANVLSRKSATLQKNPELEEILKSNFDIFSFPSFLRKYFLANSLNILMSGTHGKTTTSSIATHILMETGQNPSFLIGGQCENFHTGFALNDPNLFVLESDEYDSAFFDKGPKFFHYVPSITLINNIEFDHADIYDNIEAIEEEFYRLCLLTKSRAGTVVANIDDPRVLKLVQKSQPQIISFGEKPQGHFHHWRLEKSTPTARGLQLNIVSPENVPWDVHAPVFGPHSALNICAVLATLDAYFQRKNISIEEKKDEILSSLKNYQGVKRRFELLTNKNQISVFDDFAHHPTAIQKTLRGFRDYLEASQHKEGRLIVCFDPKNATLRRNVFQKELSESFDLADMVLLGKVPTDMRTAADLALNPQAVIKGIGEKAKYFSENAQLLEELKQKVKSQDTVVFMSSGSFDGLPHAFADHINSQGS